MLPPSSQFVAFLLAATTIVKTATAKILPTTNNVLSVSSFVPPSLPTRSPASNFPPLKNQRFIFRDPPYPLPSGLNRYHAGTSAFLCENIAQGIRHRRQSASPASSSSFLFSSSFATEASTQQQQQQQRERKQQPPPPQQSLETNLPTRKRPEIFQRTNAISKFMPVPHPDLWKINALDLHESTSVDDESNESILGNDNIISGKENKLTPFFWKDLANNFDFFGKNNFHYAHGQQQAKIIKDITVKFDNPTEGASLLLQKFNILANSINCNNDEDEKENPEMQRPELTMQQQETLEHLTNVLSYFQNIASAYHHSKLNPEATSTTPTSTSAQQQLRSKCQARIVSTIGPIGTKCPRWHADHVPVRLVMSIIGPGCEFVPHEMEVLLLREHKEQTKPRLERTDVGDSGKEGNGLAKGIATRVVDRSALNHLEDEDTRIANDLILPPERVNMANLNLRDDGDVDSSGNGRYSSVIYRATEGEAVLLMGRGWEDKSANNDGYENEDLVLAAVHRSPTLDMGQHRVLLTVDLVNWDYE